MEITVAMEATPWTFTDQWGGTWELALVPLADDDIQVFSADVTIKGNGASITDGLTRRAVERIISATAKDGSPIGINGKPATDVDMALVWRGVPGLRVAALEEAAERGKAIVHERGNSSPAPGSQ